MALILGLLTGNAVLLVYQRWWLLCHCFFILCTFRRLLAGLPSARYRVYAHAYCLGRML